MIQQTSIIDYYELDVSNLKELILVTLRGFKHGLTDSEIIEQIGKRWDKLESRVRRHKLGKEGVIICKGKRKCTVTGKTAMVWAINRKVQK